MRQLKAILSAVLLFLFSLSIGGAWHYCGGNLAQFKVNASSHDVACGMGQCNMTTPDGAVVGFDCCEDVVVYFSTDDYQASEKPGFKCAHFDLFLPKLNSGIIKPVNLFKRDVYYKQPPNGLLSVDRDMIQVYLN